MDNVYVPFLCAVLSYHLLAVRYVLVGRIEANRSAVARLADRREPMCDVLHAVVPVVREGGGVYEEEETEVQIRQFTGFPVPRFRGYAGNWSTHCSQPLHRRPACRRSRRVDGNG